MLGFEVNYTGLGDGSLDALYAVTGCKTPMDSNNRGCTGAPGLEVVILNPNPKRVMTSLDRFSFRSPAVIPAVVMLCALTNVHQCTPM